LKHLCRKEGVGKEGRGESGKEGLAGHQRSRTVAPPYPRQMEDNINRQLGEEEGGESGAEKRRKRHGPIVPISRGRLIHHSQNEGKNRKGLLNLESGGRKGRKRTRKGGNWEPSAENAGTAQRESHFSSRQASQLYNRENHEGGSGQRKRNLQKRKRNGRM